MNQMKLGVYLSYFSIFITNITNLILTPFIVRNLGQSEYGLYMLIGALVGYIAVLDFGLGNTVVRYVAKYRAEENKIGEQNFLFITLIIYSILSFILLIVGIIILFNLETLFSNSLTIREINLAKIMFVILIINLAITLPAKTFASIITAYEHFALPQYIIIGRTLIRFIAILILLSVGYNAVAIVLVDTILHFVITMINVAYVFLKLKVRFRLHNFNKSLLKEILSYSSLIFISVLVDQIYWRIGHLVLGIVASTNEVALFAIGMMLAQYVITFSTAISGVFLPKITKMVIKNTSEEELTSLLIKTGRLQFLLLGFIICNFILFGKKFILLWLGVGYEKSWTVAILIMIPLVLVLTQSIGISILQAKNKHGFRAFMYLSIAIVNLFISVRLGESYGALGVSLGTTSSLIFGNLVIMNLYYHFIIGLNIPRFFREIFHGLLLSSIISVGLGACLLFLSQDLWFILLLQCLFFNIIYFTIMWKIGMNSYEKQLFANEFVKIKSKLLNNY